MAAERELERKAVEELLREANRGRERAETMGPAGWMKCPLRSTNKRFLMNTLRSPCSKPRPPGPAANHRARKRVTPHSQRMENPESLNHNPQDTEDIHHSTDQQEQEILSKEPQQ